MCSSYTSYRLTREKEIMILINSCDEKRFCTYLAEAIQEMSPDFCRRLLYARPLETEDLSSYWGTAMCESSLSERAEKGFSTYEMLDVLEKLVEIRNIINVAVPE